MPTCFDRLYKLSKRSKQLDLPRRPNCKRRTLRLKLNGSGMFVPCESVRCDDVLLKKFVIVETKGEGVGNSHDFE